MEKTSSKSISTFMLAMLGILLATIIGLSVALNRSTEVVARLQDKVAAGVPRPGPAGRVGGGSQRAPDAVAVANLAQTASEIDEKSPESPEESVTYYESKQGKVQLRVLARGQRLPLHTHRRAGSAVVIVSGTPQITHRFRRQAKVASLTARYAPGSVVATTAMIGEEVINTATDHTQASLVFSAPADDGNFYLGPGHDEAITGSAPAFLDVEALVTRLRTAGKAVVTESFGPLGDRLTSLAVAAPSDLGPFPELAVLYVLRGGGSVRSEKDLRIGPNHLIAVRANTRISISPSESPLVMLLFRPENDGTSDIVKKGTKLYSQFDEELLIREFFRDRRDGFFVDIGAADYQRYSTTFYLEERLGWKGIAVDALASYAPGYAAHRPKTKFLNYLVTDRPKGKQKFYETPGFAEYSSTHHDVAKGQLRNLDKQAKVVELAVPSITLNELFEQQKVERIDFLSIDVEEHEPQALEGFDIERFRPELVCVEAHPAVQVQLLGYFDRHGYTRIDRFLPYDHLNWYFTPRRVSSR